MSISEVLLPEFDQEMASTRRLLERVPTEKGEWKPHTKSFSLGHLTQLVCWMPGWITNTLTETELNLTGASPYITKRLKTCSRSSTKTCGRRALLSRRARTLITTSSGRSSPAAARCSLSRAGMSFETTSII